MSRRHTWYFNFVSLCLVRSEREQKALRRTPEESYGNIVIRCHFCRSGENEEKAGVSNPIAPEQWRWL